MSRYKSARSGVFREVEVQPPVFIHRRQGSQTLSRLCQFLRTLQVPGLMFLSFTWKLHLRGHSTPPNSLIQEL